MMQAIQGLNQTVMNLSKEVTHMIESADSLHKLVELKLIGWHLTAKGGEKSVPSLCIELQCLEQEPSKSSDVDHETSSVLGPIAKDAIIAHKALNRWVRQAFAGSSKTQKCS